MKRCCIILLFAIALFGGLFADNNENPAAQRVFVGRFVTNNPHCFEAAAVAVDEHGFITDVYPDVQKDYDAKVVELPGELVLPGLHDAHAHLDGIGRLKWGLDLRGVTSTAALRKKVQKYIQAHPHHSFVKGFGWDQSLFPGRNYPDAKLLNNLSDKPIFLSRIDGHGALVNRVLLDKAGINKYTPEPQDGAILRYESGEPTGILIDGPMNRIKKHLPDLSHQDRVKIMRAGVNAAAQAGLVAVHDMSMAPKDLEALLEIEQQRGLPVRVFAYVLGKHLPWLDKQRETRPWLFKESDSSRVQIMGIKLFMDGTLGSRGALLFDPYADQPGHYGAPASDLEEQHRIFQIAQQRGFDVAIHAIGDSAASLAFSWIEHDKNPKAICRIEHAQVLRPEDMSLFARLNVVASMQPKHLCDDLKWLKDRIGEKRFNGAYAWKSVLNTGAFLAFGSDAPVTDIEPVTGFYAAMTRKTLDGKPDSGWCPEERLTFGETLRAYTSAAAQSVGCRSYLGRLQRGYAFDITILDRDVRESPEEWLHVKPVATCIQGKRMERFIYKD